MKTLHFGAIVFVIVLLSSCGGKEKLTQENTREVLEKVLGYPCLISHHAQIGNERPIAQVGDAGFIEYYRKKLNSRSHQAYAFIDSWDNLLPYMVKGDDMKVHRRPSNGWIYKIEGKLAAYMLELGNISNISEEVDGKVTVQFNVYANPTKIGQFNIFGRLKEVFHYKPGPFDATVVLQRTEDGWMAVSRDDFKSKRRYDYHSIDEYPSIEAFVSQGEEYY